MYIINMFWPSTTVLALPRHGPQGLYYNNNGHARINVNPARRDCIKLTTDKVGIFHQATRALLCAAILKIIVTAHINLLPKIATPLSLVTSCWTRCGKMMIIINKESDTV